MAVCLSGGGSRAMAAGMGQLRALKHLQLDGKSLLARMLWQTLVGSNILEPYGLYTPSKDRAPDSLFSFDRATLEREVFQLNPDLSEEQAAMHLIASGRGREQRPFSICNMAMFLDRAGTDFSFLAPVQSSPFITGVLGRPQGKDANGRTPEGGAVTSFGFASEPRGSDQGLVTIKQDRQWALTDSIGTSSAFFAEALQNLFKEWSLDVDLFFEGVADVAEELEDWLRRLLMNLGLVGRVLSHLVDGIAQATGGADQPVVRYSGGQVGRDSLGLQ